MVTPVIVVLDEARDLGFEITGQVIVTRRNTVLEGLVQALRSCPRSADGTGRARTCGMPRSLATRKIARGVARSLIAEQSWLVHDHGAVAAWATNASSSVSVDIVGPLRRAQLPRRGVTPSGRRGWSRGSTSPGR